MVIFYSILITILFSPLIVEANDENLNDILNGIENSFSFPFDELNKSFTDKALSEYLTRELKADIGISFVNNDNKYSPVFNTDVKFSPVGNWFAEAAFFLYFDKDEQKSWSPDFVYRFGYEDWRPYTLSFVYSNYASNRSYSDLTEKYDKGTYSLSWHFPVPDLLARPFLIEPDKTINCTFASLYTPTYNDQNGETGQDQFRSKVTFNAPVYGGWYFSLSILHYLDSSKQQPWDLDYTFEAGWRDENFSVAYKNYSGNRFPWRTDTSNEGGGLAEGSIGITWYWDWLK